MDQRMVLFGKGCTQLLLLNTGNNTQQQQKKNRLTGVRLHSSVDSAFRRVKDKGAVDGFYPRVFKKLHLWCVCVCLCGVCGWVMTVHSFGCAD